MKRTATKLMTVALILALAATILMPGHFKSTEVEPPVRFGYESFSDRIAEPIAKGYGEFEPRMPPSQRPPPQI